MGSTLLDTIAHDFFLKVTAQLEDKYTGFDAKVDEVEYIVDRDEQNLEKKTEKEQ